MQLNVPVIADCEMIRQRRQAHIDCNVERESTKRPNKDCVIGDQALIMRDRPTKMEDEALGPFVVQQVHANATVTMLRNASVHERINVRRIKPCCTED